MRSGKLTLMISCAVFAILCILQIFKAREMAADLDKKNSEYDKLLSAYISLERICTSSTDSSEDSATPPAEEGQAPEGEPQVQ